MGKGRVSLNIYIYVLINIFSQRCCPFLTKRFIIIIFISTLVKKEHQLNCFHWLDRYDDLTDPDWKTMCEGVQAETREQHLSDEEFAKYFPKPGGGGFTKDEFNGLPKWKQSGLKRKAKLF